MSLRDERNANLNVSLNLLKNPKYAVVPKYNSAREVIGISLHYRKSGHPVWNDIIPMNKLQQKSQDWVLEMFCEKKRLVVFKELGT